MKNLSRRRETCRNCFVSNIQWNSSALAVAAGSVINAAIVKDAYLFTHLWPPPPYQSGPDLTEVSLRMASFMLKTQIKHGGSTKILHNFNFEPLILTPASSSCDTTMDYCLSWAANTLYIATTQAFSGSGEHRHPPVSQFISFWHPVLYRLADPGGSAASLTAEYIKVNWIKRRKRMSNDWKMRAAAGAGSSAEKWKYPSVI